MEENAKKIVNYIHASEARADAEKAQENNFEKALERIHSASKMGEMEIVLFGCPLNLKAVQKLMDLGFSVTQVSDQNTFIKMYKIGW